MELTLKYRDERLAQLIRQQRIRQLPEVLFNDVRDVMRLRAVEAEAGLVGGDGAHVLGREGGGGGAGGFHRAPELRYPGLDARFAEYAHLELTIDENL